MTDKQAPKDSFSAVSIKKGESWHENLSGSKKHNADLIPVTHSQDISQW